MRKLFILSLSLLITACTSQEATDIRVEKPWIAEIPPMISVTAALMVLHNESDKPKYLIEASSPKAKSIEIHKSIIVNDLAKMIKQSEVEIPPHGIAAFSNETGYHLMFYGTENILEGQKIPVSLKFKDGSVITVTYDVLDRRKML